MATFVKIDQFAEDIGLGVHDLNADTLKVMLTNDTITVATDAVKADVTEIATSAEYVADGIDVVNTWSETAGTATLFAAADPSWTAGASGIGPFQRVVLLNVTQTTPLKPLIGYWEYPSPVTLSSGESFSVTINVSLFTLA